MADDVLVNKAATIERAVRRVREEHAGDDGNLLNQTRQDAISSTFSVPARAASMPPCTWFVFAVSACLKRPVRHSHSSKPPTSSNLN